MPCVITCAYAGCAKDFETRHSVQRYCSRSCGMRARPGAKIFGAASLRFHVNRARGRQRFVDLTGVSMHVLYRELPTDDTDAYHRGELVSIGGILVKKCNRCDVARQLESYHSDNTTRSGCRPVCAICREKEDDSEYFKT